MKNNVFGVFTSAMIKGDVLYVQRRKLNEESSSLVGILEGIGRCLEINEDENTNVYYNPVINHIVFADGTQHKCAIVWSLSVINGSDE